jgi:hypothetical protein
MLEIDGAAGAPDQTTLSREALTQLNRDELVGQAQALDLKVSKNLRKNEVIQAILEAKAAAGPEDPDTPPPVPAADKGPSGLRINDPVWKALNEAQREAALELAKRRFVMSQTNLAPAQCLQDGAKFVTACKNKGLL